MLTTLDYSVIAIYFVGVIAFGIWSGGRQGSSKDYFLGGKNLPWWAICFSIVATETSTLTVIGIPAVSYGGALTFIQITLGYLVGRILVSYLLLPRYFAGEFQTAYEFLGQRFGRTTQKTASVTFLVTRLLADGVRLFATAIPIKLIADSAGFSMSYMTIIALIGVLTIIYTIIGGIRAVVWMDVVQMTVYVGGALMAIAVLLSDAPANWFQIAQQEGKTAFLDFEMGRPLSYLLTHPYAFITALVGGAIFTMASHGSDQLIVQRLLACKDLRDSQKALIGSGLLVMAQFVIFLFVGLLLWIHFDGASIQELGLSRADEVFPRFIIEGLPSGLSGFILAGIVAAAMSTLSSSLNALSSSTVLDLFEGMKKKMDDAASLKTARVFTLVWGIVFILFAGLFEDQTNPVVELGLAIATFTYGGMLGLFLLGLFVKRSSQFEAMIGFLIAIVLMIFIIKGVRYSETNGWLFILNSATGSSGLLSVAWPLYTLIGAGITMGIGSLLSMRKRNASI